MEYGSWANKHATRAHRAFILFVSTSNRSTHYRYFYCCCRRSHHLPLPFFSSFHKTTHTHNAVPTSTSIQIDAVALPLMLLLCISDMFGALMEIDGKWTTRKQQRKIERIKERKTEAVKSRTRMTKMKIDDEWQKQKSHFFTFRGGKSKNEMQFD